MFKPKDKKEIVDFTAESLVVNRDSNRVVEVRDLAISGPVDAVFNCLHLILSMGGTSPMKQGGVIPKARPNPSGASA